MTRYLFSEFLIDIGARELRRGGVMMEVSPKIFDCIAYLIKHRDRAVGRDELIAATWERCDVADVQLTYLMRKLRRTLSDDGENQRIIRTIPRFGFRWVADIYLESVVIAVAPMREEPAGAPAYRHSSLPTPITERARYRFLMFASGLALALIATAGIALFARQGVLVHKGTSVASKPLATFAVLPVEGNVGSGTEWMRLGLMDLIAARLRRAQLNVARSSDIMPLLKAPPNGMNLADRIHVSTGVGKVIAPTIVRNAGNWLIRLELHGGNGKKRVAQAEAPDAILAARQASDRLLDLLGQRPSFEDAIPPSSAEILQRAEAAMLVDDFASVRQIIDSAPEAVRALPQAKLDLGRVEIATGRVELAGKRLATLLSTLPEEGDQVLRASVLNAIGVAHLSEPGKAAQYFSTAIDLLETLDEPNRLGDAYNGRGIAYRGMGRYDAAASDYARARVAFSLANDTIGLARVDNNEGVMDSQRGHVADALPLLIRTADRFEKIGALDKMLSPMVNVVSGYLELLQPADALAVYRQAEKKFDGLEDPAGLQIWKLEGVSALIATGHFNDARTLLDQLAQEFGANQDTLLFGVLNSSRAELEYANGQFDAARMAALASIQDMSDAHGVINERARAWLTLIRSLRALKRDAEGKLELDRLVAWSRDESLGRARSKARIAEAEQALDSGSPLAAWTAYENAFASARDKGTPAEIADVAVSFGNALIDENDLDRASTVAGHVGRWSDRDFACALLQVRLYQALGRREAWLVALDNARALAGERAIPEGMESPPRDNSLTRLQ